MPVKLALNLKFALNLRKEKLNLNGPYLSSTTLLFLPGRWLSLDGRTVNTTPKKTGILRFDTANVMHTFSPPSPLTSGFALF